MRVQIVWDNCWSFLKTFSCFPVFQFYSAKISDSSVYRDFLPHFNLIDDLASSTGGFTPTHNKHLLKYHLNPF